MKNSLINICKYYQDYLLFLVVVLAGVFTKIYRQVQRGRKPSLSWFIAELIISLFIAFSVYTICDQFLNLTKMITYTICAWGGTFSTLIQDEVEELIESFFDALKKIIKTRIF